MKTCRVLFQKENKECMVPEGTTILQAMLAAGIACDSPCGGHGTCGKCKVRIRDNEEHCGTDKQNRENTQNIRNKQNIQNIRNIQNIQNMQNVPAGGEKNEADYRTVLACQTVIGRDLVVLTESEGTEAESLNILEDSAYGASDKPARDTSGVSRASESSLTEPSADAAASPAGSSGAAVPVSGGYMAAFDIGTTTVVGYLLNGKTGEQLAVKGMLNPQTAFGADVISRIEAALRGEAENEAVTIRGAVNSLIGELCAESGIQREEVAAVSIAGNTCMHHLFLGIPTDTLARIPYSPALTERRTLNPADYGLQVGQDAVLEVLPVIAGFVGADTVACLLAGNWTEREKISLLIDIGTNGEMVLGSRERMLVCSTAAGPAFEGARISCGMRGAAGAIDHVKLVDGEPVYHVIGDGPAKGLCGSGLLDLIAVLVELELIDETGKLEMPEYPLGNTGLTLTRKDVREVQLAKAAIASGIQLMTQYMGLTFKQIETVEIAGAFGSFMDIRSVCAIGMIPPELESRVRIVGNAAGEGAKLALLDRNNLIKADRLAAKAEFLELATLKNFQDTFVDALEF